MNVNQIQNGTIIKLGNHTLLCGDCTNKEEVQSLITDAKKPKISLILTDPPYGVKYVESKENFLQKNAKSNKNKNQNLNQNSKKIQHKKIENDDMTNEIEFAEFTQKWLENVKPYMAEKNASYIFMSDTMLFALRKGMQNSGWKFGQLLVWAKENAVMGRLKYLPQHELIAFGWKGKQAFYKSQDKSLICCNRTKKNVLHPTMKPVPLLRRLILNSSKPDEIIFDPFGGSGSTLMACQQLKRKCVMIEKDKGYCEVIVKRFKKLFPYEKVEIINTNQK